MGVESRQGAGFISSNTQQATISDLQQWDNPESDIPPSFLENFQFLWISLQDSLNDIIQD